MDLNDLKKLANFYGISLLALLSAPDDAPKAEQMQKAADLASRLDPDAFEDWMRLGKRLGPKPPTDS